MVKRVTEIALPFVLKYFMFCSKLSIISLCGKPPALNLRYFQKS